MALSEIDRSLLQRCLAHEPRCWEDFVDRFIGVVVHVVNHTAQARNITLTSEDCEDLCAEVFLTILQDDYAVLRHFRGQSSLATYLTVIGRRIVVRRLLKHHAATPLGDTLASAEDAGASPEKRISDREEVQRLLAELSDQDATVVRLYHLEGRSYQEISHQVGMPENSIGPTLSRARARLRKANAE